MVNNICKLKIYINTLNYLIINIIYSIFVITPINLGTIVQILKILRGTKNPSIKDIFNYFDKLWMSIAGYMIFIIVSGLFGIIILTCCSLLTGFDFSSIELNQMIFSKDIPIGLLIGFVLITIPLTYLYIKSILFFEFYIMDRNMGPINAIKSSFIKSNGMEGEIFLIICILIPLYFSMSLCGFPIILFMPYIHIIFTIIYLIYFEKEKLNEEKTD